MTFSDILLLAFIGFLMPIGIFGCLYGLSFLFAVIKTAIELIIKSLKTGSS